MRKRLRHWLFEARGKKCRFCCLFCHYWYICQNDA
nr:MAG TPA: Radical SAM superfamily [Caudoviricetes sp.]